MPHTAAGSIAPTETLIAKLRRDAFILNSYSWAATICADPTTRARWRERSGTCILHLEERQTRTTTYKLVNLERQSFQGNVRVRSCPGDPRSHRIAQKNVLATL